MLGDEEIDDVFPDRKVSSVFWVVLEGVVCRLVVDDVWVEGGVCWKMIVALVEVVDNNDWEAANGELQQTFGGTMFFVLVVLERSFGVLLTGGVLPPPPLIFFFTTLLLLGVVFFEPPPPPAPPPIVDDDEQDGC